MPIDLATLAAVIAALVALISLFFLLRQDSELQRLRLLAEQALAGQRGEGETLRLSLAGTERALTSALQAGTSDAMGRAIAGIQAATLTVGTASDKLRAEVSATLGDLRTALEARLRELREGNEAKLGEIQKTVNEQLHEAVEKQMTASFARVIEQFAAVQKAMGDVQAVTAQIGDIKRLFGNVRTRGGWGETQLRALLDDILPVGAYVTNYRPRPNSAEVVEFAVIMPMRGETKVHLPIDAKFPVEDYERMLAASESGDAEAARLARRGLERRIRDEARKISEKYIFPPATVEFAVLYLPTDGLYIEVAQIPGLIDEIGRMHRVILLGPSLFPALLRTIHLGHVTLALEQNTAMIGQLLGATRTEMAKIDVVLERLGKQAGGFSTTIEQARTRTRAVDRKLRSVEAIEAEVAEQLIGVVAEQEEDI